MKNLNIRVFRSLCPGSNSIFFEYKESDSRGSSGFDSIKQLAKMLKMEVNSFLEKKTDKPTQATIDFKPFHDGEIPGFPQQLEPRKCFPLTQEEQEYFWEQYYTQD